MYRIFQGVMARTIKLTRPRKLMSTALAMQKAAMKSLIPARKKKAAATIAAPLPARSRAPLGETVRRIGAGGMPARKPMKAVKTALPPGATFKAGQFAVPEGKRAYKLYRPALAAQAGKAMPLVVMLHGCTQTPDDFATGTGMNRLADELGFLVVYPAQNAVANGKKCWNWFQPSDQMRDAGEPELIAGITRQVMRGNNVDPSRVYVAGLSAGGAAAAIIASAYPDIFAAAGVHSGLPIGAAQNAVVALMVMQAGSLGVRQSVPMPTIIFHGDADTTVHPSNGRAIADRAAATFSDLSQVVKNGRTDAQKYTRTSHRAGNRKSFCEHWVIEGAGHAWSGGNPAGSFAEASGPDASREMLRFFLQHRLQAPVDAII